MNARMKNRTAFRPSVTDASLENRLVLTAGSAVPAAPPPAPPPVQASVVMHDPTLLAHVRQIRANDAHQAQSATLEKRNEVARDTALQPSSQARLLPRSTSTQVPAVQTSLSGSGTTSSFGTLGIMFKPNRTTAAERSLESFIDSAGAGTHGQTGTGHATFSITTGTGASVSSSSSQVVSSASSSVPSSTQTSSSASTSTSNTISNLFNSSFNNFLGSIDTIFGTATSSTSTTTMTGATITGVGFANAPLNITSTVGGVSM